MPDPRYFSMPSIDDGAELRRKRALNCWPWVRSLTHSPDAVIHSPAATMAAWPTTVTRSRWPRALTLRTQNPLSGLWKVTRSTSPARTSRSADPGCRSSRDFTMSRARERSATSSRTRIVASARPPLHGSSKSSSPRETASMLPLCSATISKSAVLYGRACGPEALMAFPHEPRPRVLAWVGGCQRRIVRGPRLMECCFTAP